MESQRKSTRRDEVVSIVFTTLQIVATIAPILLFTMALLYLFFSSYYDHCEALIASLSRILLQGDQPLYHGTDTAARYSVSYGPMLYLLVAAPELIVGSTILSSKIAGILACALALFVLYRILRTNCEPPLAQFLLGLFALFLLLFENYAYWNRPDPFLVLCVVVGLATANMHVLRGAAISVGVVTGVAMNLKIHGVVYLLPVIALWLMRQPQRVDLILAITSAVVVFAAPFLLPQISMADYLQSLTVAPQHGLSLSMLMKSAAYLSLMLTPLIAMILMAPGRKLAPDIRILLGALAMALMAITIISGKRGAGPHHFLPVLPVLIYIGSRMLGGQGKVELLRRITDNRAAFAGFALLTLSCVATAVMAVHSQAGIATTLKSNTVLREATQELDHLLTRYSGASIHMGYTDQASYRLTHLRPLTIARSNPYWLDAVALMDYDAAGIPMPAATIAALEACVTQFWILPSRGEPFSMRNYYATGRNIFGEQFGRVFALNYELIESSGHYAVWQCRASKH